MRDRKKYIRILQKDIAMEGRRFLGAELKTIFIGGGTPSLFDPSEIKEILEYIKTQFIISDDIEITMETNPGSLEYKNLSEYRFAGVNRLSIGAQSFNQESLKLLGRIHGPSEIFSCYEEALLANFESINIDLMFGLPNQTLEMATEDMRKLIDLNPEHISYYQLTLEPNTLFYKKRPKNIPPHNLLYSIHEEGLSLLSKAGYERYEISAFAKLGLECRHNINYWMFGDYIAVGAGAHGKYAINDEIKRYQKPALPRAYMNHSFESIEKNALKTLDQSDILLEYMINNLRLMSGFSKKHFECSTGLSFHLIEQKLTNLQHLGLMKEIKKEQWVPTALGFRFLDDIQAEFLPA
jgi:oxygen-independent coproporphyrinogen-3 oxidase